MILRLEGLLERVKILGARWRLEREHLGALPAWIWLQRPTLTYAAILTATGTALDLFVFRSVNLILGTILAPMLAASTAALYFLTTSWLTITQSAAARFNSPAVVRRLSEDWSSELVLRLLAIVVLATAYALAIPPLFGFAPVALALLPAVLFIAALPVLLTYRRYGLVMFQPSALAEQVARDVQGRFERLAAHDPGRSVASHWRAQTASDLEAWDGLLAYASERDAALHDGLVHQLGIVLGSYLHRGTRISADSEWFPYGERASDDERDIRHIFEEQGLGPARLRARQREWFEERCIDLLRKAARRESPAIPCRAHVVAVLAEVLRVAWHAQRMDIVERLEERWDAERKALTVAAYDDWSEPVVNGLMRFADQIMRERLRVQEALPIDQYPDRRDTARQDLPAVLRAEFEQAADEIEAEQFVSGQVVTPIATLGREREARLRRQEGTLVTHHLDWVTRRYDALIEQALQANASAPVLDLYASMLLIINRAWYLGLPEAANEAIIRAPAFVARVAPLLAAADRRRREHLLGEARTIALKAIRDNREAAPNLGRVAVQLAGHAARVDDQSAERPAPRRLPRGLETVLAIGGLAFAAAEIRQRRETLEAVVDELPRAGFDPTAVSRLRSIFARETGGAVMEYGLTLEYHRYLLPLYREMDALGTTTVAGAGGRIPFEQLQTPSAWLRRHAGLLRFSTEDAIGGFLDELHRLTAPPERRPPDA